MTLTAQGNHETGSHGKAPLPEEAKVGVPAAETLAEFAIELFQNGMPQRVHNYVIGLLADQIGLQLACAKLPWSKVVWEYAFDTGAPGRSTIFNYGQQTNAEFAAFCNAAFGHGQDFDDTCQLVQTHPGAVIIPTAMAIGEQVGASGQEVIRAIGAGLEVMLRVAHSVSPDCLRRGHHTPPASGPFGAAIAAGLLLGLDRDRLVEALAIAGSFSGGLIEYTQSGGSVKRIHTAIPTTSGIRAANLAMRGLTGPHTVLDGVKGFCRVFADNPHIERLTEGLGQEWIIERVALKNYNCCYFIHAPLEAAMQLVAEEKIDPAGIARIDVGTSAHGAVHVGTIVNPVDPLGGQFSVQFTLGLALLEETPGLNSYTDAQLGNDTLQEFARKVTVYTDQIAEAEYPGNWGGIVTVVTYAGDRFERRVRFAKGTPENPMSPTEIWQKFYANTEGILSPERRVMIHGLIDGIDGLAAINELTDLLVADVPTDNTVVEAVR
jgi:2-methylcitrate dehydratase PrpD